MRVAAFRNSRVLTEKLVHAVPGGAALVIGLNRDDLAQFALMHALGRILVQLVSARLEIDQEAELFRGSLFAALFHREAARHIDGNRFGHINVFAGLDGGGGVLGMEIGRRFDDDRVQFLFEELAIAGKAGEAMFRRDVELPAGFVHAVLKIIGGGNQVVVSVFLEQTGNPFATPAATDQANIELGIGVGASHEGGFKNGETQNRCAGAGEKPAAGDGGIR